MRRSERGGKRGTRGMRAGKRVGSVGKMRFKNCGFRRMFSSARPNGGDRPTTESKKPTSAPRLPPINTLAILAQYETQSPSSLTVSSQISLISSSASAAGGSSNDGLNAEIQFQKGRRAGEVARASRRSGSSRAMSSVDKVGNLLRLF